MCLGGLLCLALNASALTFTYSGTVSSSTARLTGETETFIDVGDAFNLTIAARPSPLGSAMPTVSFTLTIGEYFWQTYPFEYSGSYTGTDADFSASSSQEIWGTVLFRGAAWISMTETGGSLGVGMQERYFGDKASGTISVLFGDAAVAPVVASSQPVPDTATTLGLLALGFASVIGVQFHRSQRLSLIRIRRD